MASVEERLTKLREERIAREKARIDKLRAINLKKYNGIVQPASSSTAASKSLPKTINSCTSKAADGVNNAVHVNGTSKRPTSATAKPQVNYVLANKTAISISRTKIAKAGNVKNKSDNAKDKHIKTDDIKVKIDRKNNPLREIVCDNDKSKIPRITVTKEGGGDHLKNHRRAGNNVAAGNIKPKDDRKNDQPNTNKRETVFDRLYKPKILPKQTVNNAFKLQTDPKYLNKVIKDSKMLMSRRHTTVEPKQVQPVRRSISAVHLKRISKSELSKCVHKWASVGEKINDVHLEDIIEDEECDGDERVVSAVKSERKKVKFQTPTGINTPRPEELLSRLVSWLQGRGKSLEAYHHLQCFAHHLPKALTPLNLESMRFDPSDDDKENIALENDSDNESFRDNMNNRNDENRVDFETDKWRRASYFNDSVDINDSRETTLTSCGTVSHDDDLLAGALNDLTELLREGYPWEQCARWVRAVRARFPGAAAGAAYWECRAALEERRGNLPESLSCWERALASGAEHSVADANLDNLLDKFMQLKIIPDGCERQIDPKLVDVKNVFKSTIIRFGVQQAKLRQSTDPVRYTVTPVRRSARLSVNRHTPMRLCSTLREASELGPIEFVPNKALVKTP